MKTQYVVIQFLDLPALPSGGSYVISYVRLSVTKLLILPNHRISWIFGTKLAFSEYRKVTKPDF